MIEPTGPLEPELHRTDTPTCLATPTRSPCGSPRELSMTAGIAGLADLGDETGSTRHGVSTGGSPLSSS